MRKTTIMGGLVLFLLWQFSSPVAGAIMDGQGFSFEKTASWPYSNGLIVGIGPVPIYAVGEVGQLILQADGLGWEDILAVFVDTIDVEDDYSVRYHGHSVIGHKMPWGSLSVFYQLNGEIQLSQSTLEYFSLVLSNRSSRDEYPLKILNTQIQRHGVQLGIQVNVLPTFSLEAGIRAWQTQRFMHQSIVGTGSFVGSGARFEADSISISSTENVFRPAPYTGGGYAFDLDGHWVLSETVRLRLGVENLFIRENLENIGRRTGKINSSTVFFDENNYINYGPLLSGRFRYLDQEIDLLPAWHGKLVYERSPLTASYGVHLHEISGATFNLMARYGGERVAATVAYLGSLSTWKIGLEGRHVALNVFADSFDYQQTRTIGVNVVGYWSF